MAAESDPGEKAFPVLRALDTHGNRICWTACSLSALASIAAGPSRSLNVYLALLSVGLVVVLLAFLGVNWIRRTRPHVINERKILLRNFSAWTRASEGDRATLMIVVAFEVFLWIMAGVTWAFFAFYFLWQILLAFRRISV
jgi:hypothetical protein